MKRKALYAAVLILFSVVLAHAAPAANPADYTVKIHVSSSELTNTCIDDPKGSTCGFQQLLTVTIDGKKYKLESSGWQMQLLPPGDYQARITKDVKEGSGAYTRDYELLFSDGKTAKYRVVGEFEQ